MPKTVNKPTIAVDIDEVLATMFENLMAWHNQKYGTKLTLADNHSRDLELWKAGSIEEAIKRVHGFFETPHYIDAKPIDQAEAALHELSRRYELAIITARDVIVEELTLNWVQKYFPDIFKDVHFTAEYSLHGLNKTKAEACLDINAEYLIDDSLEKAEEVAKEGIKVLLFGHYPWNKAERLPEGVSRVKNWQEVLEYFDGEG